MKNVIIVEAIRTPIGKLGGSLINETSDKLGAHVLNSVIQTSKIKKEDVDEVILGQAKQSADQSNLARLATLLAEYPLEVPGYTIHRQCGSGLQAILNGAMQIKTENANVVVVGGVESMSTAPYYVNDVRFGLKSGNVQFKDPNTASQQGSQPYHIYGDITMGETADNIAKQYNITREEQDAFALQSQNRAKFAIENGYFEQEITPYTVKTRKDSFDFKQDEHPRDTSLEKLAKLRPVFTKDGSVTAGNASGRNDGASALLLMDEQTARYHGYDQGLKLVSFASAGVKPDYMGLGPIPATKKALEKAKLDIKDIDVIELNEAFAAQALAFYKEFNIPLESTQVNPNGGAIALGHPIGATGAIITTKLFHEMKRKGSKYGLVTLCIAGGLGISAIFEMVNF